MDSFLNAGVLASIEGCSIGDYRIDWRYESTSGTIVFKSGNVGNTDPELDAYHPLVDEIVVSGTLYPVIRYIYIDSIKYSPYKEEGSEYSPDLLDCLDPITITSLGGCDTTYNPDADYDFVFTREVAMGEASRSFRYDLGSTANFVAWEFTALQVPDRLNIYYCRFGEAEGEIIDSLETGTGITTSYNPSNYPRQPGYNPNLPVTPIKIYSSTATRYISDMRPFDFEPGDWLRIEVLGNINTASSDTKWTIKLKCFESIDTTNNWAECNDIDMNTLEVGDDTANCRKYLSYKPVDSVAMGVNAPPTNFLRRYLSINLSNTSFGTNSTGSAGSTVDSPSTGSTYTHYLSYNTYIGTSNTSLGFSLGACIDLDGTMEIDFSGGVLTLNFTSANDYNIVKNNLDYIHNSSNYTAFLASNDTQLDYYKFYYFYFRIGQGCDLANTTLGRYIHYGTAISYDYPNSITLTMSPLVNNYYRPEASCDTVMNSVNNYVGYHETTRTTTFNATTKVRSGGTGGALPYGIGLAVIVNNAVERTTYRSLRIPTIMLNNVVDLEALGFCLVSGTYHFYILYDNLYMTDVDNYTFRRRIGLRTENCADSDWEIIDQKP